MKQTIFFLKTLLLSAILGLSLTATVSAQASSQASLSVDPSEGATLNRNAVIPFTITVNSQNEPINVVSLTIEYNQSQLEFVGFDSSSSAFEFAAPTEPSGNGVVFITRGSPTQGGLTQSNVVGVVNFRVLGDSGTTSLRFGDDSNVIRVGATDIWDRNTTIGTYNLLPSTDDASSDGSSNQPLNDDKLVAIKVTDENNQSLPNRQVTVGNRTTSTDNSGTASFGGLPTGTYEVEVQDEDGRRIAQSEIIVSDDTGETAVQSFDVRVDEGNSPLGIFIGISAFIIIIALIIIFLRKTGMLSRNSANKNDINNLYYDVDALSQTQKQQSQPYSAQPPQQSGPPTPGEEINPQNNNQ